MDFRPSIAIAFVFGLILVVSAFALSRHNESQFVNTPTLTNKNTATRTFIDVGDNDKNGIPDWQDSLSIPTINLDDVATKTKTAEVAIALASNSLNSSTTPKTKTDLSVEIASINKDTTYTPSDIVTIDDNSDSALRTYGNAVAAITFTYSAPAGTRDELTILNSAFVNDNDPTILAELDPIIISYQQMRDAMLKTPVPSSLIKEHLSLINVYQALLTDITAFRAVFSDALPAMTRFNRYPADANALYTAISNLYLKLNENGIQWSDNDIASKFIRIESTE